MQPYKLKPAAIEQVLNRSERAKSDSDFTYFFSLLLAAEALAKTVVVGLLAAIGDDKDRNRYRVEHQLMRADGLGDWGKALEDTVIGPASQYLVLEARSEQTELTRNCKAGEWQYEATLAMKNALQHLEIEAEEVPTKSDLKRWFRLFATLRNKTRAHGATQPAKSTAAAEYLATSISLVYENFCLFQRPWVYLHRNLSGKYRVSAITSDASEFDFLKQRQDRQLPDGVYIFFGTPRRVALIQSDPELLDFYFANGGVKTKSFELLSYYTDDKIDGDAAAYLTPPGTLPPSETEGYGELLPQGECFSNAPELLHDYVPRNELERELEWLLRDDKRPYEVRNWRGWHHHQTLSLLATWFLVCETQRGKKSTPAITLPQIRDGIAMLLRAAWRCDTPKKIAVHQQRRLVRNEQARFFHHKARNRLPPLRINQRP